MPVLTKYEYERLPKNLGSWLNHPNVMQQHDFCGRYTRYWCPKCGWEQRVTDLEFANDDHIEWTIPQLCWTYKERWEGKFDQEEL